MKTFLGTVIRAAAFVLVWIALVYLGKTLLGLGTFADTEQPVLIAIEQIAVYLVALIIATAFFSFIEDDDYHWPPLGFGPIRATASLFLAFVSSVLPYIVLLVSGAYLFVGFNTMDDILLWVVFIVLFALLLVVGSCGYLYSMVTARIGRLAAVIVSACAFFSLYVWTAGFPDGGFLVVVALSLMIPLERKGSRSLLEPAVTVALILIVCALGFGILPVPGACPYALIVEPVGAVRLFDAFDLPANAIFCLTLTFTVCVIASLIRALLARSED